MNDPPSLAETLRERRAALIQELVERPSGLVWCGRYTDAVDAALRQITLEALGARTARPVLSVLATGGYGRRELCPWSDIDLTIVPVDESASGLDEAIRKLYNLTHAVFGALGIDVGWQYRLISDVAGLDAEVRSALLDARLVAGAKGPVEALVFEVWNTLPVGLFVIAKLAERRAAFAKTHDSPLVVEPHLKEGAGGLRCFHCANWLRTAVGERGAIKGRAYDEVLAMRNLLHVVAGKRQDLLTRPRQAQVAEATGRDLFAMMGDLAEAMLQVHETYLEACEKLHEGRYPLAEGVMAMRGETRLSGPATLSAAALGVATATKLGLRVPRGATLGCTAAVDPGEVMAALEGGEATIRNLDVSGALQGLLPEVTCLRTLLPDDGQHAYTVYEHTMRTLRMLESARCEGGFFAELADSIGDFAPLALAALLHDAGKVDPTRDHAELGEELARNVCRRWRLPNEVGEAIAWLVREHLTMARFIRMRDVGHPDTAREFAGICGSRERLTLLTLLTWADVSAVGPGAWTSAQDGFLRELFERTLAALEAGDHAAPDPETYRRHVVRRLEPAREDEVAVTRFAQGLPAHYLITTPPDDVRQHFAYAQRALAGEPTIESFERPQIGATDFTICCPDEPGLLARLLGAFYAVDLSLVGFRVCTAKLERPIALDVFTVTYGGRPLPTATSQAAAKAVQTVLRGEREMEELLRARGKDPDRTQEILRWSYHAGTPGILEVRAPRGRGMAYRLSRHIARQGWYVLGARLGQWAGQGAAAFYLLGQGGGDLDEATVQRGLSHAEQASPGEV